MNLLYSILSFFYDHNQVTYRFLRKLQHERNCFMALLRIICLILIIPIVPILDANDRKKIKEIKKNNSIYDIATARFYLPSLNLKRLGDGQFVQNRIFLEGVFFERYELERLKKYVRKDSVIIDAGANIGNHTVFFGNVCRAKKVYSFEPVPSTFEILRRNVEINDLSDRVVLINAAVGEQPGTASMRINREDAGSNQIIDNQSGDIEVSVVTIDSTNIEEKVSLIKIDVEFYEFHVLKGALELIDRDNPDIYIEILKENFNNVDSLLRERGYSIILSMDKDYLYRKV